MSDPVLFSYSLDGLGGGAALRDGAVSRLLRDDRLAWAHLNAEHPETAIWLRREVGYLDDFIVTALLADETRPRVLPVGEGIPLILRGLSLNKNMYALSVIAAIFLPLGFLTGFLGIDIDGIPGAPQAFLVSCGMLALLVGLQIVIFRKIRWF